MSRTKKSIQIDLYFRGKLQLRVTLAICLNARVEAIHAVIDCEQVVVSAISRSFS